MLTRDEEVYYVRQRGTDKILQSGGLPYVTCSLAAAHFVVATLNDAIEQALDQWEIQPYTIPAPEPPPEPEIPPMAQRDPRWKDMRLGHSSTTLGRHGCVVTCLAMMISDAGKQQVTPAQVNHTLRSMNLFGGNERNLVIWNQVQKAYPCIHFEGFTICAKDPAPTNLITFAAQKPGRYAIIQIDFDPSPQHPGIQGHYLLVTGGRASEGYTCNDPWTGNVITVPPKYCQPDWDAARAIMRVAFYRAAEDTQQPQLMPVETVITKALADDDTQQPDPWS